MGHIAGNKSLVGSIEVSINETHPNAQHFTFLRKMIDFYGCDWPSKRKKQKKALNGSNRYH